MNLRRKVLVGGDRLVGALLAGVVLGGAIGFGGVAWWSRPMLVAAAFLLVLARLVQHLAAGRMPLVKSPLTLLGLLVLALGVVQLAPLPGRLAIRLSPAARDVYARGFLPGLIRADDPQVGAELPEPTPIRSPATLDRSATLRWLVFAAACLGVFWGVSHYADRLGRLYLVWGLVVAAFLANTTLAVVQVSCRSEGFFGMYVPGSGPAWSPSLNDLMEAPTTYSLRALPPSKPGGLSAARPIFAPSVPFLFGTLPGGGGGFLAMGALALPLALAIVLHLVCPRGSREDFATRLGGSGRGSLVALLAILPAAGAFLLGMISGPWLCLPLGLGVLAVGLPSAAVPGTRWVALGMTTLLLGCLALGVGLERSWPVLVGGRPPVSPPDLAESRELWAEGLRIVREFPLVGSGLGSFPTIHAYFKGRDPASTTAMSSLLLWGVETGGVGLGILALAGLWSLIRLPGGLRRVGWGDRPLAFGLIGAALGFSLLAVVHWTVELSAVAISASALGGTWNRWLAGGTDLFTDRT